MTQTAGWLDSRVERSTIENGRSVFVTGAGSGIGRALVLVLLDCGYHIFAGVIDETEANGLLESFSPARLTPVVVDVRDETSVENAAQKIRCHLQEQKLTAVCNIAGVIVNGPLADLSGTDFLNVLAVNVVGIHNVTRAMLPLMGPGSRVINMSSASGVRTLPLTGAYSASKFGVEALTAAMRMEFRPLGIGVTAIAPGMVDTPMAARIQQELAAEPSLPVYSEPLRRFLTKSIASAADGIPMRRVTRAFVGAIVTRRIAPRYDLHHSYVQDAVIMRMLPIGLRERIVSRVLAL
ncbi:SDR family NAD(P)-dependent oxidoreductase [Rhodococcus sp. T2V]|uniref:SDR family NAD(P)-dependent oxidoreductase n=1 Tax=Rhodococcus sp. T2V TaxID=3034164 RepID=UPI0023E2CF21|nr:SDR family NAD(P)-dependent oxidoreductase [Rhodococcus sp. T2V]MDF3309701.1 SDR family NAD(P)-dependent oxidoreductase [Rhodococcus sp. T2V]